MKYFLMITSTLFLSFPVFAQKAEKDINDTTTLRFYYVLSKRTSKSEKPYRADTMILDIGKRVSRFYDPARFSRDSAMAELFSNKKNDIMSVEVLKDEDGGSLASMPGTMALNNTEGESYQIVKDINNGGITVFDFGNRAGVKLQHEDNFDKQNWKIESDTSTIASYVCQKATINFRERSYTAWFTTDIPVSEGPWKFSGLPGLILKVEDSDRLFSFELIGMTQPKAPLPIQIITSDYLKVSRAQYQKQVMQKGMGMSVNFTNGVLRVVTISGKYAPILMELQ